MSIGTVTPGAARARRECQQAHEKIAEMKRLMSAPLPEALHKEPSPGAIDKSDDGSSRRRRRREPVDPMLRAEWSENGTPPTTTRGAGVTAGGDQLFKPVELRIHALNGTFPVSPPESVEGGMPTVVKVREIVSQRLGQADDRLFPLNSYLNGCQWDEAASAALGWTEGRAEAFLQLKGSVLDALEPGEQLRMFKDLAAVGFKATRCDTAVDDPNRIASMEQIHQACAAGNFARFQVYEPDRRFERDQTLLKDMITFGGRGKSGSGKYMRIYDKFLESGGVIDAIRYEVEWSKERANDVFQQLVQCDSLNDFGKVIGSLVCGAISFLDRSTGDPHLERLPLLDWWEKFVNWLGTTWITGRRVVARLQATLQSFKHQYGCTLALLRNVLDSMGVNMHAVVDQWCEGYGARINWDRQRNRDLSLSVPMLLEPT